MPKKLDKTGQSAYALRHGEDVVKLQCKHHAHSKPQESLFRSSTKRVLLGWSFVINVFNWRSSMTTKRFALGVVSASVLVLLAVAGCGGGGGDTPAVANTPTSVPPVATPPPVTPPPVVPPPVVPPPVVPPPTATVTLAAAPTTITVGSQATLSWAPTNAVNCVASGGWTGSRSNTGGSEVVTPTATTTYGMECWNSANVTTGVVSTTLTVNPAPPVAKLSYTDVVIAIWPGFDWPRDTSSVVRIDRSVPAGYLSNTNSTGKAFYFVGIRPAPRADCLVEASALDNTTGVEYKLLYNPKSGEWTNDTSATGAAWNRHTDYVFATPGDPNYPLLAIRLQVIDGVYEVVDGERENLYFRSNAGVVTQVIKSTFAATGGFKYLGAYSCKQ